MYYYCNDCNEIMSDSELDSRPCELGDSLPPGSRVGICPYCGSEDLVEASTCDRCGTPIPPDEHLCDNCEGDLYGIVDRAVCEVGGEYMKAKETLFDYMERRWF